ncbi:MAG: glycosyltransferase family 1 protein [Patescibacteria group bacterium]
MRLGVDLRCLAEGEQGGIAVYAQALIPRLARHFAGACVGFVSGARVQKPVMPFDVQHVRWPNKLVNASLVALKRPRLDAAMQADIVFAPTPKYLALAPGTPLVLTVHDLSFIEHPEYFTRRQRFWHHWLRIGTLLERADRIIAVSEHTAADIRALAPSTTSRIRVIASGADHGPATPTASYPGLPQTYALAFASAEPRKNIANIIRAHELAFSRTGVPLVLVGSGARVGQGIIRLPYLSADDRWRVLGNAQVLLYPSLYEGFGFPPLEAMRLGVPVVASHVTSLPEVLGAAALYVDPWDPQDIARGIEAVHTDAELRADLRTRGLQHVATYHWDTCATLTAAVIHEAYAHRH